MSILRWLFFSVCAWSVTSAWSEDRFATPGSNRFNVYLVTLGVVAILALYFEFRDVRRSKAKTRD
jgi:hypothetical protein